MNTRTLTKRPTVQLPTLPRLLLLALFFLAGVLLGQVLSGRVPDTTGDELRRYLEDYVRLGGEGAPTVQTALSALVIYFRYPLFAFLLGFASIGVVLLPCVTAAYGFFLSFSVCCFTAAFGVDGVLLALAVFGLRCLVTLPLLFPAGGGLLGDVRGTGGRVLWERTADCPCGLRPGLLGPVRRLLSGAAGGCVCGAVFVPGAAAADAGAHPGVERKREGGEHPWQETTLRTLGLIWRRSVTPPRTPSAPICGT